jgi:hypothetical protein
MGWFVSDERIPVEVGCRCDGSPHDLDTVWLRKELAPEAGFAAMAVLRSAASEPDKVEEKIGRVYAQHGIVEWTFLDGEGEPIPATKENIARLSWDAVYPIAQKGDDLYAEALTRPLAESRSRSSRRGQTGASTSPSRTSTRAPRKPSRRSTTAITPLHPRLGKTSDGGSSSSPRKRSA